MKKTLLQFTHGIIKPHNLDNWKSEQDKRQPLISMKIFVFKVDRQTQFIWWKRMDEITSAPFYNEDKDR